MNWALSNELFIYPRLTQSATQRLYLFQVILCLGSFKLFRNLTEEYLLMDSVIHRDKSGFPLILFHGATPRLVQESNDVSHTEPGVPYHQCQLCRVACGTPALILLICCCICGCHTAARIINMRSCQWIRACLFSLFQQQWKFLLIFKSKTENG